MINVARDFSPFAAGRHTADGPYSGERFREEILLPSLSQNAHVTVDLDGTLGLGSSFLEEAFGGLVRAGYRLAELRKRLAVKCRIKSYEDRAWQYIAEEEQKTK